MSSLAPFTETIDRGENDCVENCQVAVETSCKRALVRNHPSTHFGRLEDFRRRRSRRDSRHQRRFAGGSVLVNVDRSCSFVVEVSSEFRDSSRSRT
ncbi:hypothetical protein OESDEN_08474 [Oesophagostomum dentatum]|uniref:Uncharacterized protein n=1 Tax=Oesophagostomum dentatum TaxID=61180 RepID=A0A0B1T6C6_OESDE|nr:hypothetical protein OESDEN_08474 [Oesophagostomum dentatum]